MKDCYECKYYESKSMCCQYMWNTTAIRNTNITRNCKNFKKGKYNPDEIEKEFWDNI